MRVKWSLSTKTVAESFLNYSNTFQSNWSIPVHQQRPESLLLAASSPPFRLGLVAQFRSYRATNRTSPKSCNSCLLSSLGVFWLILLTVQTLITEPKARCAVEGSVASIQIRGETFHICFLCLLGIKPWEWWLGAPKITLKCPDAQACFLENVYRLEIGV